VYNGYYVYRINNFLRDYDHTILYDFIIVAPYPIFGGTELYNCEDSGICISANYLYGAMFLQTENENINKNLKYNINYKFLEKSDDVSGYIIETNDYNLRVEEVHVEQYEGDMGFSLFDGGSIQKTSTIWILLIALIILLIFMYLSNVNKRFSRIAANRISGRNCNLSLLRSAA
jgi:hypothetical protein